MKYIYPKHQRQAMHPYIQMRKTMYIHRPGNTWFLLVEALPQSPENTNLCSGNAAKLHRLRVFAIAEKKGRSPYDCIEHDQSVMYFLTLLSDLGFLFKCRSALTQ